MRYTRILPLFLCLWGGMPTARPVMLGDGRDAVREELGAPKGVIKSGGTEVWVYPLGRVSLEEGHVVGLEFLSREKYEARERARLERAEARARQQARAREQRIAEGQALKERMVKESSFITASPDHRLAWWMGFQARYPEISVQAEIESTRFALLAAREKAAREAAEYARIAALERRVEEAEARAERAERRSYRNRSYYYGWPAKTTWYPRTIPVIRSTEDRSVTTPQKNTRVVVNGFARYGAR